MSFSKAIRFCVAEKIIQFGVNPMFHDMPEDLRLVHTGFAPLLIHRSLRHYQRAIGLTPGDRGKPAWDFLSEVLGHHRGHDAILRDALGESLYKSLQHLRHGTHTLTNTTLRRLAQKLGVPVESLSRLEGHPDRVILGYVCGMNFWHEFIPNVYVLLKSRAESMAQHRADRYSAACEWWGHRLKDLEPPECIFLDRLLVIAIGIVMLSLNCGTRPPAFWFSVASPSDMSDAARHPMGNWLQKACSTDDCDDLYQWYQKRTADVGITYEKLRKWSAGTQTMPLEQGMLLIGSMGIPEKDFQEALSDQHLIARLVSFAQEFIAAASPAPIDHETARRLIDERLSRLQTEMFEASFKIPKATIDAFFDRMAG